MKTVSAQKIAVAISGGVDSAVAAALLQRDGYAPTAFFARGWSPKESRCDWAAEERDAMRVAAALGIPFRSIDLGEVYEREVVGPLIDGYRQGRAVNPDVWCNKAIKFGALLDATRAEGFSAMATGHYATLRPHPPATHLEPGRSVQGSREASAEIGGGSAVSARLYRGADTAKDQSYFLWALGPAELRAARFPLGGLTKPEVRALAKEFDLPVAEKPDSQGVCFVGEMDFKDFLRARLAPEPGTAVDERGEAAGQHDGAALYVPGERVALANPREDLRGRALYVLRQDVSENRLVVSPEAKSFSGGAALALANLSETSPGSFARATLCQLRYRAAPVPVIGAVEAAATRLASLPFAPTPGQSAVFYAADGECLGGGEIASWERR